MTRASASMKTAEIPFLHFSCPEHELDIASLAWSRLNIMNSYIFLIHFSSFCRGLQAKESIIDYYVYVCPQATLFFLRSEFLFGCMLSSFSICFHYGSYPAFNWLFYASFCSMSLLAVICYDFCARELANRPKAAEQCLFFISCCSQRRRRRWRWKKKEYIASEVEVKLNQRRLTTTNVHDKKPFPPSKTKKT